MVKTMTLNKADVLEILNVLNSYEVDYFELVKNDGSGIGYGLEVKFQTTIKDRMVTVTVPVVTEENW